MMSLTPRQLLAGIHPLPGTDSVATYMKVLIRLNQEVDYEALLSGSAACTSMVILLNDFHVNLVAKQY